MKAQSRRCIVFVLVTLTGACARGEHLEGVRAPVPPRTARAAYEASASAANAERAARWDEAGSAALRSNLEVDPGFQETLAFPADRDVAVAYRMNLKRGDNLDVEVKTARGEPAFVDVFEVIDENMFRHVFAPDHGTVRFHYRATSDREHIVRIQPPEGVAARYEVRVNGAARVGTLTFPVKGESPSNIEGVWGDSRDGGARDHKGVDIMAPRGTAVIAVADGTIQRVGTDALGGRVIWERDGSTGLLYYYAHLDKQLATEGDQVRAGETIGKVGNTGNAAGGPTHLHFGIYSADYVATNPSPYLLARNVSAGAGTNAADNAETLNSIPMLGITTRLPADRVRLRAAPSESSRVISQLDEGIDVMPIGAMNGWVRVLLSDGTTGFIASKLLSSTVSAESTHDENPEE